MILLTAVPAVLVLCLLLPRLAGNRQEADPDAQPVPPAQSAPAPTDNNASAATRPPAAKPGYVPVEQQPEPAKTREELEAEMRAAFKALPNSRHERVISDAVRTIVGLDNPDRDYREAMGGLRKLTRNLRPDDIEALREFIAQPMPEDGLGTMRKIEYNALRNDVLHVLVKQDTVPEDLHLDLIAMYLDAEQDDVWRTYSAQFLPIYWEARWPESESSPPPSPGVAENEAGYSTHPGALAWEGIRDTLREALNERHNSVAGTVLIGMNDLRKSRNAFSEDEIREAAIEIALDTNASEASRVTALRICGQLGADEILEETRFLAQAGHTGMLRLAAMATLGDLGDRQDARLLTALAEENERFKTVAATAITKINRR